MCDRSKVQGLSVITQIEGIQNPRRLSSDTVTFLNWQTVAEPNLMEATDSQTDQK